MFGIIKSYFSISTLLILTTINAIVAAPAIPVGNNIDIFFNGKASVSFDDNLALDEANELDDFVYNIVTGIEVGFGRGESNADLRVLWQEDIVRYTDESQFDEENTTLIASGAYEGARIDLSSQFSFIEQQSNTNSINFIGNLIEQDIFTVNRLGEYEVTPKTSFSVGVNSNDTEFKGVAGPVLPDREQASVPITIYHEITPKLDLSLGYRYRDVDVESLGGTPGNDGEDHNFTVGMRGDFTPKLNGEIRVGYQERNFDLPGVSSNSSFSAEGELVWQATPKMELTTNLISDFGLGGAGGTIERKGVNFDLNYGINQLWYFGAQAGFENTDFINTTRDDDLFNLGLSLNYSPNEYIRVTTGYSYLDNDSNTVNASFSRNLVNVSASLRY